MCCNQSWTHGQNPVSQLEELLKVVDAAYHLQRIFVAVVPFVTLMKSYTPTGSKTFDAKYSS